MYLSLILLAAALTPTAPAIAAPDTVSRSQVLAVLGSLTQAMATRDTALLARQFLPGARLVGMRPRDGGTVLQALTVPEFAAFMAGTRGSAGSSGCTSRKSGSTTPSLTSGPGTTSISAPA